MFHYLISINALAQFVIEIKIEISIWNIRMRMNNFFLFLVLYWWVHSKKKKTLNLFWAQLLTNVIIAFDRLTIYRSYQFTHIPNRLINVNYICVYFQFIGSCTFWKALQMVNAYLNSKIIWRLDVIVLSFSIIEMKTINKNPKMWLYE